MDVRQVVESITVLAEFNAIGCHPLFHIGPTLGLYGKHCTHVHKLNLVIWYNIQYFMLDRYFCFAYFSFEMLN